MAFFNEFFKAVRAYYSALDYINLHRLWKFFFIPALLNLLVFVVIGILAFHYSGELINYFSDLLDLDQGNAATAFAQILLAILIRIIVFLAYLKLYRYFILILLAPVLALMAEKLFSLKKGEKIPFSLSATISNAWRGIRIALANLVKELSLTIAILILAVILPVVSPVAPLGIFLIESYFYGFSMLDYFNEFEGLNPAESKRFILRHKGLALGNGVLFNAFLLVPFFGVLFAPIFSLVAAHLSREEV